MKANPNPDGSTLNVNAASWRFSTVPSGETQVATAVNNYSSKSQNFQLMNSLVQRLDNQFKGLPPGPGPGTQFAWTSAVADYAAQPVCGCPGTISTGQKLYRLVNYFLTVTGRAENNDPPPVYAFLPIGEGNIRRTSPPITPVNTVIVSVPFADPSVTLILQLKQGNSNPQANAAGTTFVAGNPAFLLLWNLTVNSIVNACTWGPDGQPAAIIPMLVEGP
jgi:hypothetical protein